MPVESEPKHDNVITVENLINAMKSLEAEQERARNIYLQGQRDVYAGKVASILLSHTLSRHVSLSDLLTNDDIVQQISETSFIIADKLIEENGIENTILGFGNNGLPELELEDLILAYDGGFIKVSGDLVAYTCKIKNELEEFKHVKC